MQDYQTQALAIKQAIDQAEKILVVSHQSPDGDTIASGNAWIDFLRGQNKKVSAFCLDPIPENLNFLPHNHHYSRDPDLFKKNLDIILIIDSGSLERSGVKSFIEALPIKPLIINIDHHHSNPNFGDINLVIASASSTCEVTTRLFRHWQVDLHPVLSDCLLTGIITDTSGLTNPATQYLTIQTASHLIAQGANFHKIFKNTHHSKSVDQLRLWGLALERLQKNKKYSLAYTYINRTDLEANNVGAEALDGLANYLAVLAEAEIIMVLRIEAGLIKGSLRTPFDHQDVSQLARILGGDGHKKSAGFIMTGRLEINGDQWTVI